MLEHNKIVYDEVIERLKTSSRVCIVQATGTGKGVIASSLIEDYVNVLVIAPTNAILENYRMNLGVNSENVIFYTYQGISMLLNNQIEELGEKVSLIILDEFHRIGAETWGRKVEMLCDRAESKGCKTVGLSATPVRYLDNERDMSEEFFKGNVVNGVDFIEAVVEGILPSFKYITSFYGLFKDEKNIREKVKKSENITKLLNVLENNYSISNIIKQETKELNDFQKWAVFFTNIEELEEFKTEVVSWFDAKVNVFVMHTKYNYKKSMEVLNAFNNSKKDINILLCINMLNEGVHVKDLDGVMMFRRTISPIIYLQQLGRAFRVGGKKPIIFDFIGNFRRLANFTNFSINFDFVENINKKIEEKQCSSENKIILNSYCEEMQSILQKIYDFLYGRWSEEEIEILKKYYPLESTSEIQKKYLPNKTRNSIYLKLYYLGLCEFKEHFEWTEDKLQKLKEVYLKKGIEEAERIFPEVTRTTLYSRLRKLGAIQGYLQKPIIPYTEEEIEIIKKYYSVEGSKIVKRLPNRTALGIQSKANNLGIKTEFDLVRNRKPYTEEEDAIITKYYPTEGFSVEYRLPNRSVDSIRKRAQKLGISCLKTPEKFSYTPEEDDILKKYYPIEGMGVLNRLKCRSENSVAGRVKILNLSVEKISTSNYTQEEDEIIRKYYPIEGTSVIKRLKNKSINSLKYRVKILNVSFDNKNRVNRICMTKKGKYYTKEEDEILRTYYPIEGLKVLERLDNRTIKSVLSRVNYLGIKRAGVHFYTSEEDEIIRKYYPIIGFDLCEKLGVDKQSLQNRAQKLGVTMGVREYFTEEEDEIIRNYFPTEGYDIVKRLKNRSKDSIKHRAKKLGVSKNNKQVKHSYTEKEDNIIREYFPIEGFEIMKRLPYLSKNAIQNRARRLGVTTGKHKIYTEYEDNILKKYFSVEGYEVLKRLENRTKESVRRRVSILGLNK